MSIPNVLIPDINAITKEEWREHRKKGIGGSDAGAIIGINKYRDLMTTYYNKIGAKEITELSKISEIAMEIGNRLEDYVAELFQEQYPSIIVKADMSMYQHSDYPFMFANIDRRLVLPDNSQGILECKTMANADDWESTDFCRGIIGKCPLSYEYQVRHYMAVLDLDIAIVAGLDLAYKTLYIVIIQRDLAIEKKLIEVESAFWKVVESRTAPLLSDVFLEIASELRREVFLRYYDAEKGITRYIESREEIDAFNQINDNILIQKYHSAEANKAKGRKEDLAMQLFLNYEAENGHRPDKLEFIFDAGDSIISQYVQVSDTTSVSFDGNAFIEEYNAVHDNKLDNVLDDATLIALCHKHMPDRIGEFTILGDEKARMTFGIRKELPKWQHSRIQEAFVG